MTESLSLFFLAILSIPWNGFILSQIWNLFFPYKIGVVTGIALICIVGVCNNYGIPDYTYISNTDKMVLFLQHSFLNPSIYMIVAWIASAFK